MSNREGNDRVVWIDDEGCFGTIVGAMGAYYTTIRYIKGGMEYEVMMESDEFTLLEDLIEYDD